MMSNLKLLGSIIRMCLFIQYNKQVLGNNQLDTSYLFRFMPLLSFPLSLWFVILTQMTMGCSYTPMQKNMMATDSYIVVYLRKDYEESYSKLGHRWKDYAQREYDIIDKVQKDFYWWASIHRLMKVSKVLAKVMFVIRRMEGTGIHISRSPRS